MENPNCILRNLENDQRIYLEPNCCPFLRGWILHHFVLNKSSKNQASILFIVPKLTYHSSASSHPARLSVKPIWGKKTWKPTPRGSLRRTFVSPGSMFFCNTVKPPLKRIKEDLWRGKISASKFHRVQVHGGQLCKLYGCSSRENPPPKTASEDLRRYLQIRHLNSLVNNLF